MSRFSSVVMLRLAVLSGLFACLSTVSRAEEAQGGPPAPSTAPAYAAPASSAPVFPEADPEVSISTAPDIAVTEKPGEQVFLTLTRSAYPEKDLPFNSQAVTPADFKIYGPQNAGDAISRLTGISIAPEGLLGTARLAGIRGSTSQQTLVLLDGRPVGGVGFSGSQDLSEIPTEQIDRIEIVRGGMSALYGPNAVGGVINIITPRSIYSGKPASSVGFEYRSYDTEVYRLNFGSRYKALDYFFFANRQMHSGFRDNSDARTHNIGGNMGYSMGKGGKLLLDVGSYHAAAGVAGQLVPDLPPEQFDNHVEKDAATPDTRRVTDTVYVRSSYLLPLGEDLLAALRLFDSKRAVELTSDLRSINTDRHEFSRGGEAQFTLPLGLLAGGAFLHDRVDSRDLVNPGRSYAAGVENWGVFLQETFKWRALTVIPGGRYDHHSEAGESKTPRVQLIADATPHLRFSGSAARSFRAPAIDELFTPLTDLGGGASFAGNPFLRPEKAWTYDAGFEVHGDSFVFRTGYFRANVSDLIQTTADPAATTVNIGEARRQGMELELSHVPIDRFRHSVNYTYLENVGIPGPDAAHPAPFTDFVTLRLSPRHTVNYAAAIKLGKRFLVNNTLRYVGPRFEGNGESGTKLRDYYLWGMRVGYQMRQAELYLGIDNITNKRYQERGGYPLPGTTAYGGLTIHLWG